MNPSNRGEGAAGRLALRFIEFSHGLGGKRIACCDRTVLLHRLVVTLTSVQITPNGIHVMNIAMNNATAVERSCDNSYRAAGGASAPFSRPAFSRDTQTARLGR